MKKTGWIVVGGALVITITLWVLSKSALGVIVAQPWRSLGQISALLGTVLLSFQYMLAARVKTIERWFGGLDKVYRAHGILGGVGFALIMAHPLSLMANAFPNARAIMSLIIPSAILPYDYGMAALYIMLILLVATVYVKLPYHIWKKTHIFMGIPLIFMLLHVVFISSDISRFMPLRVWVIGLVSVALGAYVYKRFFYTHFGPRYDYAIATTRQLNDMIEITLKPLSRKLSFVPGQFVFLSFASARIPSEKHPFTISSSPQDELLRFSIKALGDFTASLGALRVGDRVSVFGPYGEFGERVYASTKDQIWVAGGIGITPFLSLARSMSTQSNAGAITLFYCTKNKDDAYYADELAHTLHDPQFTVVQICSDTDGRINAERIVRAAGDPKDKLVLLCGPGGMVESLTYELTTRYHVPRSNIISELFYFLTS